MKFFSAFAFSFLLLFSANGLMAQTSERDAGVALYIKRDYQGAITALKKVTKQNANDATAWFYLGMSYLAKDKGKDAQKALELAVKLDSTADMFHAGLAYFYHMRRKPGAHAEARKALEINPKNSDALYVLAAEAHRARSYNTAYEKANEAIAISPGFAAAYLLKAQSLISSFLVQAGTVVKPRGTQYDLMSEASESLKTYLRLAPTDPDTPFYTDYLAALKFFTEYYSSLEPKRPAGDGGDKPEPGTTPLKIVSKPRPSYTDRARGALVSGTIELLVGFEAGGKVGHILIVKGLGFGLDQQAVAAARKIQFVPATKNGVAVSVARRVEYSFLIY